MLLLLLLGATGCSYVKDRTNDLLDVFWLDLDVGALASAQVRCTDFLATGVGVAVQTYPLFSLHGRYCGQVERGAGGVVVMGPFNLYARDGEMVPCLAGSGDYPTSMQPPPMNFWFVYPTEPLGDRRGPHYDPRTRGWHVADCAVGACALLGVRLGCSPGQFVDFVCGIFGWDPAGDDVFVRDADATGEHREHSSSQVRPGRDRRGS